jgi:hypothetical protein
MKTHLLKYIIKVEVLSKVQRMPIKNREFYLFCLVFLFEVAAGWNFLLGI